MHLFNLLFSSKYLLSRLLIGVIYSLAYNFLYKTYMYPLFGYMGVEYRSLNIFEFIIWLFLSVFPLVFYKGFRCISSFILFFVYLLSYVPILLSLFCTNNIDSSISYSYSIALFVFMCLYFDMAKEKKLFRFRIKRKISLKALEILTLAIMLILLFQKRESLVFVNILSQSDLMYDLRAQYSESSASYTGYLLGWLKGAFLPFLLVIYLKEKRWFRYFMVLIGYLLLFMLDMQKVTFLLPFIITGMYYINSWNSYFVQDKFHSILILLILIPSFIFYLNLSNPLVFGIAAIFIMRTICVSGWLTQLYLHFFDSHPYTYFSHINIVNFFSSSYPYKNVLGRAVSYGEFNANATFWLTDGISSCGLLGIIVISIVFYYFLQLLNAVTKNYDNKTVVLIFIPAISAMLNVSLFTSILTGGLGLLILFLLFVENPLQKEF